MKEIVPAPPPIVRNQFESVRELFAKNVVPSYGRFDLALSHGAGSYVFDVAGKRYLDLGGGIAVNAASATRIRPSPRRSSSSRKS
jgi:4-aminobutyrate aminotransferase-like enzyme